MVEEQTTEEPTAEKVEEQQPEQPTEQMGEQTEEKMEEQQMEQPTPEPETQTPMQEVTAQDFFCCSFSLHEPRRRVISLFVHHSSEVQMSSYQHRFLGVYYILNYAVRAFSPAPWR